MNPQPLQLLTPFAKGKKTSKATNAHCVIYTRVSTKEQADTNMSLTTQKKACEAYAIKQGFTIWVILEGRMKVPKPMNANSLITCFPLSKKVNRK
ncbi:recombinase family protein [Oscillatoria amoena NRMC-F 0135]|nr:recombinase family protein [Oscillatoria amoena NRMC-F 0135]